MNEKGIDYPILNTNNPAKLIIVAETDLERSAVHCKTEDHDQNPD